MVADFWVNEGYYNLILWAVVGAVLLAVALVLYRKRDLECAGDAAAFPVLSPVFQVIGSLAGGMLAVLVVEMFGLTSKAVVQYSLLACGLGVGWFGAKMFLDRSTRVFRLKNWIGLGFVTAAVALSLVMTHFDVFGIETWVPRADKVNSVTLFVGGQLELTEEADIAQMIRLQEMALEDRQEEGGRFPVAYIEKEYGGSVHAVDYPDMGFDYGSDETPGEYDILEPHYYADWVSLTYRMKNGREVNRRYAMWTSLEEGKLISEYASRWEHVWENCRNGYEAELDLDRIDEVYLAGVEQEDVDLLKDRQTIESLLAAVRADCDARTMTQDSYYHRGSFREWYEEEQEYGRRAALHLDIYTKTGTGKEITGLSLSIFPDSANTIRWLQERDLMHYEIVMP